MEEGRWRVLHVITNHEKQVTHQLAVRGVEHYLPLYSERSRWSDRVVTLERPLFAGYVFARFAPAARIAVISAPGVVRLLGDRYSDTIDPEEIQRIQTALRNGCELRPHPLPAVGTRVRVTAGVFAGTEGIISELRQRCKVVIALAAARQAFSLEMASTDIEVLAPARAAAQPTASGFAFK